MSNLRLNVLGNFEALLASGDAVSLPTRKAEALLTYLALAPGQPLSRERLFNLLWSDRGEEQARNSLRQCLNTIKKSLGDEAKSILDIERTTISLKKDLISVDVLDFEQLAGESERESMTAAVSLNQGEFLEGISIRDEAFQEWLDNKRDLLNQSLVDVLIEVRDRPGIPQVLKLRPHADLGPHRIADRLAVVVHRGPLGAQRSST